jgi:hypothetical protein
MIKKDDKVSFDGEEYLVLDITDRNIAEPLQGVKLLGNVITIRHISGAKTVQVYEWDLD